MNFMFECHENIRFISSSQHVLFFLLCGETNSTKAKAGIVTSLNDTTLTKVTYGKYASLYTPVCIVCL